MSKGQRRQFLTVDQAAAFLNIPTSTLRDWRFRGLGPPSFKFGGHVRYDIHDLEKWTEAQREGPSVDRLLDQRRRKGLA